MRIQPRTRGGILQRVRSMDIEMTREVDAVSGSWMAMSHGVFYVTARQIAANVRIRHGWTTNRMGTGSTHARCNIVMVADPFIDVTQVVRDGGAIVPCVCCTVAPKSGDGEWKMVCAHLPLDTDVNTILAVVLSRAHMRVVFSDGSATVLPIMVDAPQQETITVVTEEVELTKAIYMEIMAFIEALFSEMPSASEMRELEHRISELRAQIAGREAALRDAVAAAAAAQAAQEAAQEALDAATRAQSACKAAHAAWKLYQRLRRQLELERQLAELEVVDKPHCNGGEHGVRTARRALYAARKTVRVLLRRQRRPRHQRKKNPPSPAELSAAQAAVQQATDALAAALAEQRVAWKRYIRRVKQLRRAIRRERKKNRKIGATPTSSPPPPRPHCGGDEDGVLEANQALQTAQIQLSLIERTVQQLSVQIEADRALLQTMVTQLSILNDLRALKLSMIKQYEREFNSRVLEMGGHARVDSI